MALPVGIHENVVVSKTVKNEKGSLVITIKKVVEVNPMDVLNSGSANSSFEQPEQDFLIYPPKLEGKVTGTPDTPANLMLKIAEVKDPLTHILLQYTTENNLKWDIFKGTGVTSPEDLKTKLTNQATLSKIYDNIVDQFIAFMKPFVGDNGKKLRMLFVRQSAAKFYPRFRSRYLQSQPFAEPMTIPTSASKLAFSDYDKKNGYDNPNPAGGAATVSKNDAASAASLFKAPAA